MNLLQNISSKVVLSFFSVSSCFPIQNQPSFLPFSAVEVPIGSPNFLQIDGSNTPKIDVKFSLDKISSKNFSALLSLHYIGKEEISSYKSFLPWENTYSMTLVAIPANGVSDPLRMHLPVDDPTMEVVKIKPGQTLKGKVNISSRFYNFFSALNHSDVILFWSYQLKSVDGSLSNRVGGWLIVPKVVQSKPSRRG